MRAFAGFFVAALFAAAAGATPPFGLGAVDPDEPISITADKLEASEQGGVRTLAFRSHVVVRQGALEFRAQELSARYPKGARQPEWLQARGHVRIREGVRRAECDEASYDRRARQIVCRGEPVRLWEGDDRLSGREVIFDLEARRVRVEGQCEVEIHRSLADALGDAAGEDAGSEAVEESTDGRPAADREARERLRSGGPVSIHSGGLEAQDQDGERWILFTGDVRVRQDELTLQTAELEATYPRDGAEPDRLLGRGGVVLAEGEREGRCERADYRPRERRVTCEGDARLRDGPDELTGQRIVFDFADQRVEVSGDTKLRVAPREGRRS